MSDTTQVLNEAIEACLVVKEHWSRFHSVAPMAVANCVTEIEKLRDRELAPACPATEAAGLEADAVPETCPSYVCPTCYHEKDTCSHCDSTLRRETLDEATVERALARIRRMAHREDMDILDAELERLRQSSAGSASQPPRCVEQPNCSRCESSSVTRRSEEMQVCLDCGCVSWPNLAAAPQPAPPSDTARIAEARPRSSPAAYADPVARTPEPPPFARESDKLSGTHGTGNADAPLTKPTV